MAQLHTQPLRLFPCCWCVLLPCLPGRPLPLGCYGRLSFTKIATLGDTFPGDDMILAMT
jgi:hypothetical protein